MINKNFIEHVVDLSGNYNFSKINDSVKSVGGFTSNHVRHLLNNICNSGEIGYLEIGIHHCAMLIAASFMNKGKYIGIDNFSQLGSNKLTALRNADMFKKDCNIEIIEGDCFDQSVIDQIEGNSIDVFVYDGDHEERSQYNAMTKYIDKIKDNVCFIVDDWNWANVRSGTMSSITNLGLNVIESWDLYTPDKKNGVADSWWNGLGIFLLEKNNG